MTARRLHAWATEQLNIWLNVSRAELYGHLFALFCIGFGAGVLTAAVL